LSLKPLTKGVPSAPGVAVTGDCKKSCSRSVATDHSKRRGGIIENALTDYPCWADNKLCCATFAQQKDTAASQIDEQIVKKFDEAFNNGDAAAVAALYTEDAVQVLRKNLFSVGRPSKSFLPGCSSKD
jgi:hypothetical protein